MRRERFAGVAVTVGLCLRADRARTLGCMLLFTLRPLSLVFSAYGVKLIVDAAADHDTDRAVLVAAAIAVVNAVGFVAGFYGVRLAHAVIESTSHLVDREMMDLVLAPPGIGHLARRDYLDELEVLATEQGRIAEGADVLALVLGALLRGAFTVVLLGMVSPWLLLIVVFAVPSVLAGSKAERLRQTALTATAAASRRARHLFDLATSAPAGKELRVYGLQDELRERHLRLLRDTDGTLDRAAGRAFLVSAAGWLVFTAGYAGAGLLVVQEAARGEVGIGDVVMVLTLITSIVLQMTQTVRFTGLLNRCSAAGARLLWLRRETPLPAPAGEHAGASAGGTALPEVLRRGIDLRDVRFRYRDAAQDALNGVDLHLPAGAVVGLVGENGSGKSTLVKLLTRMYEPTGGTILVDAVDLAATDAPAWRERVSGVFQDFARMEFTAQHTVGVGHLPELDDRAAVADALRRAGADEVVDALPGGVLTELGHSFADGTELSGGQWQRMALARGMMRRSPLLLVFDEPTSAIDAETERLLLNRHTAAARELGARTGAITILVSHRFTSVRDADLIVVLEEGRVGELGTHAELKAAGRTYAQLYAIQATAYQ